MTSFVFTFQLFLSGFLIRVRGEVRIRDGLEDGFRVRVRVRDRARVRARGGLDFIYYCRDIIELKHRPSGIFGKKQKTPEFA